MLTIPPEACLCLKIDSIKHRDAMVQYKQVIMLFGHRFGKTQKRLW